MSHVDNISCVEEIVSYQESAVCMDPGHPCHMPHLVHNHYPENVPVVDMSPL